MHAARQHQSSMIWPELPFRWMKSLAPFRMRKAKQRLNKQLKEGHCRSSTCLFFTCNTKYATLSEEIDNIATLWRPQTQSTAEGSL
eukprot:scaffold133010_cov18-Tisochrysis_lutea.AAC.1